MLIRLGKPKGSRNCGSSSKTKFGSWLITAFRRTLPTLASWPLKNSIKLWTTSQLAKISSLRRTNPTLLTSTRFRGRTTWIMGNLSRTWRSSNTTRMKSIQTARSASRLSRFTSNWRCMISTHRIGITGKAYKLNQWTNC